jgi:hypothetical protein
MIPAVQWWLLRGHELFTYNPAAMASEAAAAAAATTSGTATPFLSIAAAGSNGSKGRSQETSFITFGTPVQLLCQFRACANGAISDCQLCMCQP